MLKNLVFLLSLFSVFAACSDNNFSGSATRAGKKNPLGNSTANGPTSNGTGTTSGGTAGSSTNGGEPNGGATNGATSGAGGGSDATSGVSTGAGGSGSNGVDIGNGSGSGSGQDISVTDGEAKIEVQTVTFANNMVFDGHSKTCLDFKTGTISVTNLEAKYFGTAITLTVNRAAGPTTITINSASSQTIPNWKPFCGAQPNTPQAVPTQGDRDPTYVKSSVEGTQSCLEIDDGARGHQPGPTRIVNFDFGLQKCPN